MQDKVKEAPLLPGCYLYKDETKEIIYIGKAKVLRNRVKSYFSNYARLQPKIRNMLEQAEDIEYLTTDSEVEALILESNLIKKYKPKYNTLLTDDKSYVYVKFDQVRATKPGEKTSAPTVSVVRNKTTNKAEYYGPYPNTRAIRRFLRRIRRIFPYPSPKQKVDIPRNKNQPIVSSERPDLYEQIGVSLDFSSGKVTRKQLENNLNNIKKFFKGEKQQLKNQLEKEMQQQATQQNYEEAARVRNLIRDITYVGSNVGVDKDIDEVLIMQEKREKQERAQTELISYLQYPAEVMQEHENFRIECYDISNIQGTNAVGSMVVFIDGQAKPELYRRFRIRMKNEPNDFGMLQEVLTRRFANYLRGQLQNSAIGETPEELVDEEGFTVKIPKAYKQKLKNWKADESFSQKPDLIIIDGGKGQLSATYQILNNYGLSQEVPIVGLAKREEEIFKVAEQFSDRDSDEQSEQFEPPDMGLKALDKTEHFTKIRLPRRSEALYLVQRLRDEAHRFAITYHRKLRSKQMKDSVSN